MIVRQYNFPRLEDVLLKSERELDGLIFDQARQSEILSLTQRIAAITAAMAVGEEYEVDH
jgi:hypothetical protein